MIRPALALALLAAGCGGASGPQTVEGALERGDATLSGGEFYDLATVRLRDGHWLRVRVEADGFDPYLIVRAPSGGQSEMDDSTPGDTTTVELTLRAAGGGAFQVLVTSFAPGATGAYRMTYWVTADEPPPADAPTRTVDAGPALSTAPPSGAGA